MCVVWSYPWTIPCLLVKTCVLLLAPSHHSSLMSKLAPAHGKNPRNCLPNTICGRLRPVGGSGVLWCSSSALTILFVPSLLHGPRLPTISCFAYFIATSSLLPPPYFTFIRNVPIESEIMDRLQHSRCLNDYINCHDMIGLFASGTNAFLVTEIGTKNYSTTLDKSSPVDRFWPSRYPNNHIDLHNMI